MAEQLLAAPTYVVRLEEALRHELNGAEVRHERLRPDRYAFEVHWSGFDDMDHAERQRILWDIVEGVIDDADIMKISMIRAIERQNASDDASASESSEPPVCDPPYVDLLVRAFTSALPGAGVDFEQLRDDRYRFAVIWDRFDSMGHPERQQIVWNIAEKALSKTDFRKVAMILTLGDEDLPKEDE